MFHEESHVVRSKGYVTVGTKTLCIDFSETCSDLSITWSYMLGFINNVAQTIIMTEGVLQTKVMSLAQSSSSWTILKLCS